MTKPVTPVGPGPRSPARALTSPAPPARGCARPWSSSSACASVRPARTRTCPWGRSPSSAASRRMLTQIELGQANPSVSILDRVAAGLGTTFAALVGVGADDAPEGVEIWSTDTGSWAVLLDAADTETLSVETWKWKLLGSDAYRGGSGIPSPGLMHHVIDGELEIDTGNEVQIFETGGSILTVYGDGFHYLSHETHTAVLITTASL